MRKLHYPKQRIVGDDEEPAKPTFPKEVEAAEEPYEAPYSDKDMMLPNFNALSVGSASPSSAADLSTGASSSRRSAGKGPLPQWKRTQSATNQAKKAKQEFSLFEKAISDMDGYQCVGEVQYYGDLDDYMDYATAK